jgi:dihydrofolate reductase
MEIDKKFELIVAVNKDNIIGINNKIPWYIPEDLIRFKKMTEDNIVVMGRKTYESLPDANRPLKNRLNIVLTASPTKYSNEANVIFTTMADVFAIIKQHYKNKKVFIIGGSEIYALFIDYCAVMHITQVYLSNDFFLKNEKEEEEKISFFPYAYNDLLCKGFFLKEEEEKSEKYLYSKNEAIKFKYITLYKAAY